jgi:RimJ/RimL family protein N-acetyltransferase
MNNSANMARLTTDRLTLAPLSPTQLRFYLEQPHKLEQDLKLPISRNVVTSRVQRAIRMKLTKMTNIHETQLAWYTYWLLIIIKVPFGVGLAGFKGYPNEQGEAEIGYGIDPAYQNQGYMTEAVQALIAWAFEEPACQSVVARDTKKSNIASLRVLAKVGMTQFQETEDAFYLRVDRAP